MEIDKTFEDAVARAFRLDMEAKAAKEAADEAREEVKQLILQNEGKSYEGGTDRFHVVMYPTRRFSAALVEKKLASAPELLEKVQTMQVDRRLVDAYFEKDVIQRDFSTESAPTLKIALV